MSQHSAKPKENSFSTQLAGSVAADPHTPGGFPSAMSPGTSMEPSALDALVQLTLWCERLAHGPVSEAGRALEHIKMILKVSTDPGADAHPAEERVMMTPDFDINEVSVKGLRALDILCRGSNSDESCFAAMYLMEAGANGAEQPSPSEAAPLHSCAFYGNSRLLSTLLELGVQPSDLSGGIKQQLLGSSAIHALATGFRCSRADDYAECFSSLLGAGCDVDSLDRKRQSALDIAMKTAASTRDRTLVDAMLTYGVRVEGDSQLGANAVAHAVSRRDNDVKLISQLSGAAFESVARSVHALQALELSACDAACKPSTFKP